MEFNEILSKLENMGTDQNIKIYKNHGADIPLFGVSMQNLKILKKEIGTNHELGLQLLLSNNVDAIYLSQWIIDSNLVDIQLLESILDTTDYYLIIENVVSSIAAKNRILADNCLSKWLIHTNHRYRQCAYSIYSLLLSFYPNETFGVDSLRNEMKYIENNIHSEANRVRYTMNNFLISVGAYVPELYNDSIQITTNIGKVKVLMGKTSCKVPFAPDYIKKINLMGKTGFKRKLQ